MSHADERSTAHKTIAIHIEKELFKVEESSLTGAQLRALPEPDIAADRDLWLEQPGNQDDILVKPGSTIVLKPGMQFYTAPSTINPGRAQAAVLTDDDERFLSERGYDYEVLPDGDHGAFLVIHSFNVAGGGFTPATTDLMIRIPALYNVAKLDMWYCDPPIRLHSGKQAPASEHKETHAGRSWQRFSRHLPDGCWKPGVDNLRSFFTLILRELQGTGG